MIMRSGLCFSEDASDDAVEDEGSCIKHTKNFEESGLHLTNEHTAPALPPVSGTWDSPNMSVPHSHAPIQDLTDCRQTTLFRQLTVD